MVHKNLIKNNTNTKLVWEEKTEINLNESLNKVLSNNMVTEIYKIYEAKNNNLRYLIIIADNGPYFKTRGDIAVNFLVQGMPMPDNHIGYFLKEQYCKDDVYLSNVFCVFDEEEMKEKIEYIKNRAVELSL